MTPIDWSKPIEPVDEQFYAAERLCVIEDQDEGRVNLVLLRRKGRDRHVALDDFGRGDYREHIRNVPPKPVDYEWSCNVTVFPTEDGRLSVVYNTAPEKDSIDSFALRITRTDGVRTVEVVG